MSSLTERQQQILEKFQGYAYNAYEVCRLMNGHPPRDFSKCFYRFASRGRGNRCRLVRRDCRIRSSSIDASLRSLEKKGVIHSIKLRWFDGRKHSNSSTICTDNFRIYYHSRSDLASRLIDDINSHLLGENNCG